MEKGGAYLQKQCFIIVSIIMNTEKGRLFPGTMHLVCAPTLTFLFPIRN